MLEGRDRKWILFPGTGYPDKLRYERMSFPEDLPAQNGRDFGHKPFDALSSDGLPPGPAHPPRAAQPTRNHRGRVEIVRQKAGRGGKTVTVVKNFVGIGLPEKEQLAKAIQKACGTGGTVKNGQIEIQGDKRAEAAEILRQAGFRPVFAGG
jgi:translation initiation factor 1